MCLLLWCTEKGGFLDVGVSPAHQQKLITRKGLDVSLQNNWPAIFQSITVKMSKKHGGGAVTYWRRPEWKQYYQARMLAEWVWLQPRRTVRLMLNVSSPPSTLIFISFSQLLEYWALYKYSNTKLQSQLDRKLLDFECGCIRKCSYLYKMQKWRTEGWIVTLYLTY